jgi:site-specific DNA-methyltransferase (adenine-specific)
VAKTRIDSPPIATPDAVVVLPDHRTPFRFFCGDAFLCLQQLPNSCIDATITSPPYFQQKDYGTADQLGWSQGRDEYLQGMHAVLTELLRVTSNTGCCFLVIGDSYSQKCQQLIPHRIAVMACEMGWTLRNDLIWSKLDAAPDGAKDRWRQSHEHVLFLVKNRSAYQFFDRAIRVPYSEVTVKRWGNNQAYGGPKATTKASPVGQRFPRGKTFRLSPHGTIPPDVIRMATARSKERHYATFPQQLVETFVLAVTREGNTVLDPFVGTGTSGVVTISHRRLFLGFDLNSDYLNIARGRCEATYGQSRMNA